MVSDSDSDPVPDPSLFHFWTCVVPNELWVHRDSDIIWAGDIVIDCSGYVLCVVSSEDEKNMNSEV